MTKACEVCLTSPASPYYGNACGPSCAQVMGEGPGLAGFIVVAITFVVTGTLIAFIIFAT